MDDRHPLYGHQPAHPCLPSRNSILSSTVPLTISSESTRITLWQKEWEKLSDKAVEWSRRGIIPSAELASSLNYKWHTWQSLNRLQVGFGRCNFLMKSLGLYTTTFVYVRRSKPWIISWDALQHHNALHKIRQYQHQHRWPVQNTGRRPYRRLAWRHDEEEEFQNTKWFVIL